MSLRYLFSAGLCTVCIQTLILSLPKAKLPIVKNHAYSSFVSIVSNDVNVREGYVIKPSNDISVLAV